ncbi:helix-turn-helix transcriptional regulator [Lentzea jiangxiensis]|uniref:Helix-turn-helix domain-containing protein n=1 Tax=Lentzea jiangxiensis TaxID=641025 RepID=A0A1H0WSD5_9PSEU|nr:helix-turn-helix transcriptional regulator [Lentzea jiangxiensis]SDP93146.1 Helix-turn-helix domain-containing protein [Lentzea jiangxiensis]
MLKAVQRAREHQDTPPITALIPQARREQGLTQRELADLLCEISQNDSVTREEVSRWERGKRIPGPYWRAWISAALHVPHAEVDRAAVVEREYRRAKSGDRADDRVNTW